MVDYSLPTSDVINSSAGFLGILHYVNDATQSWLSRLLLIAIYIVIAMAYSRAKEDLIGGVAVAGFSTFVVAILLWTGGFVQPLELGFSFAIMVVGLAWILLDKQGTA